MATKVQKTAETVRMPAVQTEEPKRTNVDIRTFIREYLQADSWHSASVRLGMKEGSIRARVNYLRKKNVKLPLKNGGGRGRNLNVEELNQYIEELS